eukprot:6220109-Prorocentrum_lima.AAC.1
MFAAILDLARDWGVHPCPEEGGLSVHGVTHDLAQATLRRVWAEATTRAFRTPYCLLTGQDGTNHDA